VHEALLAISFSFFFFSHQRKRQARAGTQFTCFTSKKVQILTPEAQGQTAGEKRKRKTANAGVDQGAVLLFRLLDGCVFPARIKLLAHEALSY
jgi:hypothetical protein